MNASNVSYYQGKYRVESARLKGWDYGRAGWYYLTLCTRHRACHFGVIADGQVSLSVAGEIVVEEWLRTPAVRANVELDAWVLMPNHLHGILILRETESPAGPASSAPLKPGSVGAVVGQIKSITHKRIHKAGVHEFEWQPRYYDHIIRGDQALANIRAYIANNPAQWELDELNPDRLV